MAKSAVFKTKTTAAPSVTEEEEQEEEELKALERAFNTRKKGGNLLACRRCGRVPERRFNYLHEIAQVRSLTLVTPPPAAATIAAEKEGRVARAKVHRFFMCRLCVCDFLRFMQQGRK